MKIVLRSKKDGRYLVVDTHQQRLKRTRVRLLSWSKALNSITDSKYSGRVRFIGITLTYKSADDWEANDIKEFLRHLRNYLGGALVGYAWVAELQKRGAVHYHIAVCMFSEMHVPYPDKSGWWTKGMSNVIPLKRVSGWYLVKYLQKGSDENGDKFPKGLRMFAVVIRHYWLMDEYTRLRFRLTGAVASVRQFVMENLEKCPSYRWSWFRLGGYWRVIGDTIAATLQSEWSYLGVVDIAKFQPWFLNGSARRNHALSIRKWGLYRTIQSEF